MPDIDNSISGLTNAVLDPNFVKAAGPMLRQIFAITNNPGSAMQRSLTRLDEEADRLDEADERMAADNPQLEQTLSVYEDTFVATQALILANDNDIEQSGQEVAPGAVTAKVFLAIASALAASGVNPVTSLGVFQTQIAAAGLQWNIPSALQIATSFVSSPEWIAKMEGWGTGFAELTTDTILSGIARGAGPNATAAQLRQLAQGLPLSAAENLTRTLQLTSYREASLAMEVVNNEFLEHKIRIANLDGVTCLTCIDLHGTRLAIGERVDDHFRGRCTEFYVVEGGPRFPGEMQSDSTPGNRNFVPYQSGPDWFDGLSAERQAQQASFQSTPAKLRAFQAGTPLSEFVGSHVDPVFGAQVIEKSLIQSIGQEAEGFYSVNQ